MTQVSGFINKQAAYLLQKPLYAWFWTGMFAVFPFTGLLSLAVMALVTLRYGWFDGIRCLIIGVTATVCLALWAGQASDVIHTTVMTYLVCYGAACLLRHSSSWQLLAMALVLFAVSVIIGVHYLAADFLLEQYHFILQLVKNISQDNALIQLANTTSSVTQLKFAHYLFGIKVLSTIVSAILPLMLARSIQASLYKPDGFRQEMMAFRASYLGCFLLILTLIGTYQGNLLSVSCLPIFFVYLMLAGLSLVVNLLSRKKRLLAYAILVIPMVFLPYIALPIYALFGSIDSVVNIRSKWQL